MTSDVTINSDSRRKTIGSLDDIVDKEDVTVVVPTLNEALWIGQFIEKIIGHGTPLQLLVH